jgi:hypothetical protein
LGAGEKENGKKIHHANSNLIRELASLNIRKYKFKDKRYD